MIQSSISHESKNEQLDSSQFHTNHDKYKYLFWNKMGNIRHSKKPWVMLACFPLKTYS